MTAKLAAVGGGRGNGGRVTTVAKQVAKSAPAGSKQHGNIVQRNIRNIQGRSERFQQRRATVEQRGHRTVQQARPAALYCQDSRLVEETGVHRTGTSREGIDLCATDRSQ